MFKFLKMTYPTLSCNNKYIVKLFLPRADVDVVWPANVDTVDVGSWGVAASVAGPPVDTLWLDETRTTVNSTSLRGWSNFNVLLSPPSSSSPFFFDFSDFLPESLLKLKLLALNRFLPPPVRWIKIHKILLKNTFTCFVLKNKIYLFIYL